MRIGKQLVVNGQDADSHLHFFATMDREVAEAYFKAMREDLSCVELIKNPNGAS